MTWPEQGLYVSVWMWRGYNETICRAYRGVLVELKLAVEKWW
jgi:hypothetical protein